MVQCFKSGCHQRHTVHGRGIRQGQYPIQQCLPRGRYGHWLVSEPLAINIASLTIAQVRTLFGQAGEREDFHGLCSTRTWLYPEGRGQCLLFPLQQRS